MNWYLKVVKEHYADFKGRARRKEYWMFTLFNIIFLLIAMLLDSLLGLSFAPEIAFGWIYVIYTLAVLIPGLAVIVRRLHDVGKSGWFYFISLIPIIGAIWLLVLFCTDSESGTNKWGDNHKELEDKVSANKMGIE